MRRRPANPRSRPRSECDEVADTMVAGWLAETDRSFDAAQEYVRQRMPGESPQVIDGVAWSLFIRTRDI